MTDTPPSDPGSRRRDQGVSPLAPAPVDAVTLGKRIRRLMFGNPISSENAEHTLLSKLIALPVFSSDAISSVAYATQQIILVLGAAGYYTLAHRAEYTNYTMLITGLIVALLIIVVLSYWQTIFGYPSGGGSYIVSKDNLTTKRFGELPGLIAAAALLIDYVLTVSVSIAAGVQNLGGIPLPWWLSGLHFDHLVTWCLLFIALLTMANLRGLKESGAMFAIFTYGFVAMCYVMIVIGFLGPLIGWHFHDKDIVGGNPIVNHDWFVTTAGRAPKAAGTFFLVVLLSAFAQGCSAMTGTEAVSNGIPAFQEPKSRNAALTLVAMGIILGTIFLGISGLAMRFNVVYWENGTQTANAVIDQLSGAIFGKSGTWALGYYLTQFFTAAILVLAANTSFADFPRLSSILARDRYLPKQFSNLGDKLVFNNGIMILGVFAALLIWMKNGSVDALIPLYAIGVFLAFTLSQSGMVVHWFKLKDRNWKLKAVINGLGACATFLVLIDIAVEKFTQGAWAVIVLIVALVVMFRMIHSHYMDVAQQLKLASYIPPTAPLTNTVLVLVPALHRGVMPALEYARSLSTDCRAVHICTDPDRMPMVRERWEQWGHDVPLVILNSPYRSLIAPIMQYLDAVQHERHNHTVTVVVPEFVPSRWWQAVLHGQSGLRLKLALLSRHDVIVANVRYYLHTLDRLPSADSLAEDEEGNPIFGHSASHSLKPHGEPVLLLPVLSDDTPIPGSARALASIGDTNSRNELVGSEDDTNPTTLTGAQEENRAYETGLSSDLSPDSISSAPTSTSAATSNLGSNSASITESTTGQNTNSSSVPNADSSENARGDRQ